MASQPNASEPTLLEQANAWVRSSNARVAVVGKKPWRQRMLAGLLAPTATVLFYASALTPTPAGQASPTKLDEAALATLTQPSQAFLLSPVALPDPLSQALRGDRVVGVPEHLDDQQARVHLANQGDYFRALAMTLEGIETRPYRDGCGLNVGAGYCITARVRDYGAARVVQDLTQAGLSSQDISALTGNDRRAQDQVQLSRQQALALLDATRPDYEAKARQTVGAEVFDALPAHRQAALTWLAYNTGDGMAKFQRLLTAVRQDKPQEAVRHMTPFFAQDGKMVANSRAGAWLMAAYWSEDSLKQALADPDALETTARQGISPLQAVAPQDAGRLAIRGELPPSPYLVHGQVEGEVVLPSPTQWRRAAAPQEEAPRPDNPRRMKS